MNKLINRMGFVFIFSITVAAGNAVAQNSPNYGYTGSSGYRGGSGQAAAGGRYSPSPHTGSGGYAGRSGNSSNYSRNTGSSYSRSNRTAGGNYAGGGGNSYLGNRYGGGGQSGAHQSMHPETEPYIGGGVGRMSGSTYSGSGLDSPAHPPRARHSRGSSTTGHSRVAGGVHSLNSAEGSSFNRPIANGRGRGTPGPGSGTHSTDPD
jgi:hypothetical protein